MTQKLPSHMFTRLKDHHTMEFKYTFPEDNDKVYFALSAPYTSHDLVVDSKAWSEAATNIKGL